MSFVAGAKHRAKRIRCGGGGGGGGVYFCLIAALWCCLAVFARGAPSEYFHISCLDGETGNGVPLVLLRTGNYLQFYSDSAGNIAFYEPGE